MVASNKNGGVEYNFKKGLK